MSRQKPEVSASLLNSTDRSTFPQAIFLAVFWMICIWVCSSLASEMAKMHLTNGWLWGGLLVLKTIWKDVLSQASRLAHSPSCWEPYCFITLWSAFSAHRKHQSFWCWHGLPRGMVWSLSLDVFKDHRDVALRDTVRWVGVGFGDLRGLFQL